MGLAERVCVMTRRVRRWPTIRRLGLAGLIVLLAATSAPASAPHAVQAQTVWSAPFDGRPEAPTPWNDPAWDIQVHSRDSDTWQQLDPMLAHHGGSCTAPPDTHLNSGAYEDAVFQCNGHVMTAIGAGGYGAIYLTPN